MNIERLLDLADVLDAAHAINTRYHQRAWFHSGGTNEQAPNECGTPACALGHWAAANPERWVAAYNPGLATKWSPVLRHNFVSRQLPDVYLEAMEEFGITDHQAEELFNGSGCGSATTAKEAADYIRAFVERNAVCGS